MLTVPYIPFKQYTGARYLPKIVGDWDITKEYEPLMVVYYNGASYTSKTYIPAGIDISNTTYWALSADYNAQVAAYRQEVNEYKDAFDNKIFKSPKDYGAFGDGVHDDTDAINQCISENDFTIGDIGATYLINSTIIVPYGHSFDGRGCTFKTSALFTSTSREDLPLYIAVFIEGADGAITTGHFLKNVKLLNGFSDHDIIGLYLGNSVALSGTTSKVAKSVYGYSFNNIDISDFDIGILSAELWMSFLSDIRISDFSDCGIRFAGQSVNIDMSNLIMAGLSNSKGLEYTVSPNYNLRPEGVNINNGVIVENKIGINIESALSCHFDNIICDLHNVIALRLAGADACKFSNCWFSSKITSDDSDQTHGVIVLISTSNKKDNTFINCNVVTTSTGKAIVAGGNRYDTFINCTIPSEKSTIYVSTSNIRMIGCTVSGSRVNAVGSGTDFTLLDCLNSIDGGYCANDLLKLNNHLVYENTAHGEQDTDVELCSVKGNNVYVIVARHVVSLTFSKTTLHLCSFSTTPSNLTPISIDPDSLTTLTLSDGKLYAQSSNSNGAYFYVYRIL